jgi:methylenetetrahydrofolate reductase (NADPH)
VGDLDELDLINAIQSLQNGADMAGFSLNGSPEFTTGCTLGAFATTMRLIRNSKSLKKKWRPEPDSLSPRRYSMWIEFAASMEKIAALDVPVIATVFLIKSVGIARYMA